MGRVSPVVDGERPRRRLGVELKSLVAQAPTLVAPKVRRGHAAGDRGVGIGTNATATVVPHNVVTQIRLRSPDDYPIPAVARDRIARDDRPGTKGQQEAVALVPADEIPPKGDCKRAARQQALGSALHKGVVAEHYRGAVLNIHPLAALDGEPAQGDQLCAQDRHSALDGHFVLAFALERQALDDGQVLLVGASLDLDGIALRGGGDGLLDLGVLAALRADGDRPLSQTDGST
jgi:hypothetical protein